MDVDEPGRDHEPRRVDDPPSRRREVSDRNDPVTADSDVSKERSTGRAVVDGPTGDEGVVLAFGGAPPAGSEDSGCASSQ